MHAVQIDILDDKPDTFLTIVENLQKDKDLSNKHEVKLRMHQLFLNKPHCIIRDKSVII